MLKFNIQWVPGILVLGMGTVYQTLDEVAHNYSVVKHQVDYPVLKSNLQVLGIKDFQDLSVYTSLDDFVQCFHRIYLVGTGH